MIPGSACRPTFVDRRQPHAEVVLLRGDEEIASWALLGTGRPDLDMVNEVARLQLAARRLGCSIWLRHACPDLLQLLELVGLYDLAWRRSLQVVREAEGGEEAGVEEAVMPDDPVA